MGEEKEKRRISGTDPEWIRWLPDGDDNSLVDSYGNSYDNGWNFDERSDDEDDSEKGA